MHIEGKKIGVNLFKDNFDISDIKADSINNSIFVNSKDNKAESKQEKDEKNEYLNARILQVKEYTINEFKKEFENQSFKYNNAMDEATFYKALDEYLTTNINSMVFYASQDAINNGEDGYKAAVKSLGDFVNRVKNLDENKHQTFFNMIADETVKMYSEKLLVNIPESGSPNSILTPQIKFDTNNKEIPVSEKEPEPLKKSHLLQVLELVDLLGDLDKEMQRHTKELIEDLEWVQKYVQTSDTTGINNIVHHHDTVFHDLNYLRKVSNGIEKQVNLNCYSSKEELKKAYPEDKYTIVSSDDSILNEQTSTTQTASIEHFDVFDNETGKITFAVDILKDEEQIVTIKTAKNDKYEDLVYKTEYDSNGKLIESFTPGIYEYTMRIKDMLEENGRFFGNHSSIDELKNLIYQIDTDYVKEVLEEYEYNDAINMPRLNTSLGTSFDEHPNSIVKDIFSIKRTPNAIKYDLAKHVIDKLVKKAKIEGVDIHDITDSLYKELDKQKLKFKMNSSEIDRYMRCIYLRIKDSKEDKGSINSKLLKCEGNETPANGKIDEKFRQGEQGDCWLIAGIQSIVRNDEIKALLENCIEVRENGDIKVTLKGVDVSYIIPKNRLYDLEYAEGDKDVRAIEIAFEKYKKTVQGDLSGIYGNPGYEAFRILFGIKPDVTILQNNNFLQDLLYGKKTYLKKIKSGKYLTVGCVTKKTDKKAIDERGNEVELDYPHGYSITGADDKYVYFTNPHNEDGTLKMSIDDFSEAFDYLSMAKISKIRKNIKKYDKKNMI